MKLTCWLLVALVPVTAMSVVAQSTNFPSSSPSMSEARTKAKVKSKHTSSVKKSVVLDPPVAAVVKDQVLNVRGQPSFIGEVIGHVKKGETVTVLEEITHATHAKDEPALWDRIVMPTNIAVWIDGAYVDTNKMVHARKVNLRGGPGENYSIVGYLEKGAPVNELREEKGWLQIEAPTNAYAFVAGEFLEKQEAFPAAVASSPAAQSNTPPVATTPPPEVVQVPAETAPVVAQAETAPAPAPAPTNASPPAPTAPAPTAQSEADQELAALRKATAPEVAPAASVQPTPEPASAPAPTSASEAPRVVTREGFVHRAYNIQAPADFELHDIQTGTLIDYLQPTTKNFKVFVGTRVTLTGTESLDERWPRTPILHIQSVDLMP